MNAQLSFRYEVGKPMPQIAVLSELMRMSESSVQVLEILKDGFVAAVSGAIYVFSKSCSSMFALEVDNRDCNFTEKEIGLFFPEVVKHINAGGRVQQQEQKKRSAPHQHLGSQQRIGTESPAVAA